MTKILKYWPKEEIIKALQALPKDKPINKKTLIEYGKQGLICNASLIPYRFGSLKNACEQAGVRCDALYGKEHIKHMITLNIKYTKEKIIEILQQGSQEFGNNLSPTNLILAICKKNKCDIKPACKRYFGTLGKACQQAGIQTKKHYWTNEEIIKRLQQLYIEKNGNLCKRDVRNDDKNKICRRNIIKNRFGSFDKAAEYAGINFIPFTDFKPSHFTGRKGLKEDFVLDKIEEEKGIKLIRQYRVGRKFIDGFHLESNTAYEVDEQGHFHPYMQVRDYFRQEEIQKQIGCNFIRIKQNDFLSKLENQSIIEFIK